MPKADNPLPDFWPNRDTSRFVEAGGVVWHVQSKGEGPVLLLIHGTGASTHSWHRLIKHLPGYQLVMMDLPGQGFTSPLPDQHGINQMADGLAALMTALDCDPVGVIGHSAGAALAVRLALSGHIGVKTRLIALNAALKPYGGLAYFLFSPFAKLMAKSGALPRIFARQSENAGAVERFLESTGSIIDGDDIPLYRTLLTNPDHIWHTLKMMADWDLAPLLREISGLKQPLSLLAGCEDGTVSYRVSEQVARRLPGSSLHLFDGVGHLMHEESPDTIGAVILDELSNYNDT